MVNVTLTQGLVSHNSLLSPVSDKLNIINELLRVKFNYMQLSLFNRAEVDSMLYCLCTL